MSSDEWEDEGESPARQAERLVAGLVRLAGNDEAARLLGVDGTLEDEVDVTFLNDPLNWIASEIANGIRGARLAIVPDCGHMSPLERPGEVTRLLVEWLRA